MVLFSPVIMTKSSEISKGLSLKVENQITAFLVNSIHDRGELCAVILDTRLVSSRVVVPVPLFLLELRGILFLTMDCSKVCLLAL